MASPTPLGNPDSGAFTAIGKREYEEFARSEARLERAEGTSISADDHNQPLGKRTRRSSSIQDMHGLAIRSKEASPCIQGIEQLDPVSRLPNPRGDEESGYVGGHAGAHIGIAPVIAWNKTSTKGISVAIRTSFGTSTSQTQPQSLQSASIPRRQAAQQRLSVARPSTQAARALSPEFEANASASPGSQLSAVPQVITGDVREPKLKNAPDSNGKWQWIFNPLDIEKAEKVVQSLTAAKRDLMPKHVPDHSLFLKNGTLRFALPRLSLSLREISLIDLDRPDFTRSFLSVNMPVLQHVNHTLLIKAFRQYVGIAFAYLPQYLVSLVMDNTRNKSKGTKNRCAKAIEDAKNLPRPERTEQAEKATTKLGVDNIERKTSGNREISSILQANGQADNIQSSISSVNNSRNRNNVDPEVISTHRPMSTDFTAANRRLDHITGSYTYAPQSPPGFDTLKEDSSGMDAEAMVDVIQTPKIEPTEEYMDDLQQAEAFFDVMEQELLRRYYPMEEANPLKPRCLTCSELDHRTMECPLLTCTTCGLEGVHFTDACPRSRRCTKCWNRGHDKSKCPEKLAAAPPEIPTCDICNSKNHLETTCHFLWRSFHPDSLRQKKVLVDIPIFCYSCGSDRHFGPECGLRTTPLHTDGWTWSRTNWERYVDLTRNKRVFSAGQSYDDGAPKKKKKDFTIKGKAKQEPSKFEDDSDVQFISERVKRPPPVIKGKQQIKLKGKKHHKDMPFIPRPELPPVLPNSRQQPHRAAKSQRIPEQPGIEPFNSYRPSRDEPARNRRERSLSPLPRFGAGNPYGDMSYRPDYGRESPHVRAHHDRPNGDDGLRDSNAHGDKGNGFFVPGSGNRGRADSNRGGGHGLTRKQRALNRHAA